MCCPNIPAFADALQAIPAAQCVIVPINTRLTQSEVDYLLADSESALVLVDYLSTHLFSTATVPVIVCADGTPGDPYEAFLEEGRRYDEAQGGQGWGGLEFVDDELSTFAICYTSVSLQIRLDDMFVDPAADPSSYAVGNDQQTQGRFVQLSLYVLGCDCQRSRVGTAPRFQVSVRLLLDDLVSQLALG